MLPRLPSSLSKSLAAAVVAGALLSTGCGGGSDETSLTITGSSTVAPVVADAAKRYESENEGIRIDVQTGGSSRGIADVRSGLADLGMASRALTEKEAKVLDEHRIAMDGVGLIVHEDNPLDGLKRPQVVDIYSGQIDNWKDLGGEDSEIVVANKAEGRATLEVFLDYASLDSADVEADVVVGENQQAIKTVAGNPDAIGYVSAGHGSSEAEAGTPIKLLASDGVPATTEAVASGKFPITRPLQVITKGELAPAAAAFLGFLGSPAINDIVESHRYVPVH